MKLINYMFKLNKKYNILLLILLFILDLLLIMSIKLIFQNYIYNYLNTSYLYIQDKEEVIDNLNYDEYDILNKSKEIPIFTYKEDLVIDKEEIPTKYFIDLDKIYKHNLSSKSKDLFKYYQSSLKTMIPINANINFMSSNINNFLLENQQYGIKKIISGTYPKEGEVLIPELYAATLSKHKQYNDLINTKINLFDKNYLISGIYTGDNTNFIINQDTYNEPTEEIGVILQFDKKEEIQDFIKEQHTYTIFHQRFKDNINYFVLYFIMFNLISYIILYIYYLKINISYINSIKLYPVNRIKYKLLYLLPLFIFILNIIILYYII
ncbi:MAG: hypothetical protein ACK5HS_01490 [Mycoplasmatales bacterium]